MSSNALLPVERQQRRGLGEMRLTDLLIVIALLGLTSAFSVISEGALGETRLTMLYLVPVLISATCLGVLSGCSAALGAVGLLNFLFAVPHYSLLVSDVQDLLTLAMFFLVAATTGILAGNLREQRDSARAHARALQILSASSGQLHQAETRDQVLELTRKALAELTQSAVIVTARQGEADLALLAQSPEAPPPQHADFSAAELALSRGQTEPAAAPGWNGSAYTFLPIRLGDAEAGPDDIALGYLRHSPGWREAPYQDAAAEVLCQQCTLALKRLQLGDRVAAERERASMEALRAALLSSLSHDLRSPLAGILGSVTTLKDLGPALPAEARQDLLLGIETETRRLAAYVTNLLQLTRLQSGSPPDFQLISLSHAAEAAETRLRQSWPEAEITLHLPQLPLIRADAALLEQAIFNLLDNAMRHGGGEISLNAEQKGEMLHLTITDQGVRPLSAADHGPAQPGSGLGLPICRAIATAFGGALTSEMSGAGRSVTLSLPVSASGTAGPGAASAGGQP